MNDKSQDDPNIIVICVAAIAASLVAVRAVGTFFSRHAIRITERYRKPRDQDRDQA